VYILFVG